MFEKAENAMSDMAKNAQKVINNPSHEMKKSGEDWISYIKTHPIQSVFFGIAIFQAIKGMLKN